MPFLVLDGLTKRFGEHAAVENLSLAVEQGEFLALLGPSGCGKTTTLQMIAGFVMPTSGAITLAGQDLLAVKPAKRGLGIVFQSYALFPHMTAAENVAFGLDMQGVAGDERKRRVRETLELVGLGALADRYPRRMSGGQQQRVALARALVIRPSILLLDEPLSNLDAKLREEMQIELRQIQRNVGTTTILVTHDQSEAMALSDRIAVMSQGRIEQIAPPHEAYERPATPFVANFLGKTNVLAAVTESDGSGTRVVLGDGRWPASAGSPPRVLVTVRPEKIGFADGVGPTLAGTVVTRIFQGNHWLYQIDTTHGRVTVIRQNSGEPVPGEGENVRLTWRSEDMSVRSAEGAP
ncbi:MAG: ABC transporter ATP-binding protein [Hyphomicrobiaceae bacterium]